MERAEAKDDWFVQIRVLCFDFKLFAINSLVKSTRYTSDLRLNITQRDWLRTSLIVAMLVAEAFIVGK